MRIINQYLFILLNKTALSYFLLLVLIAFPVFGNLNVQPIRIWDESRLAINAYEMNKNGNWLVTYFNNSPDMWNTKPPFLIWIQVIFIKLIGIGELAIRLPSAIAAFLTCIAIVLTSVKYLKDFTFGFIASLVLITSNGYMNGHAARTGDYDAMLTFFTTIGAMFFLFFVEKKGDKYLYLFFLSLTLGVLTKGITAMVFLPGFLLYCIWQRQFMTIIKNKHLYFGLFLFLFFVLGYYLLRESYNPGYLKAVQENELRGRYLKTIENHNNGFWYYYNNLIDFQLSAWYLLLPCGVAMGFVSKNERLFKLIVFSTLLVIIFFMVISTAKTKLQWYDVPMYPFFSMLVAAIITAVFNVLKNLSPYTMSTLKHNLLPYVFLFIVFITPYQKVINRTNKDFEYSWDKDFYEMGYFLKSAVNKNYKVNKCFLLQDGYYPNFDFYTNILKDQGLNFKVKDYKKLTIGDSVITCDPAIKNYLENQYNFEILEQYNNVLKYKITGIKQL